MPLIDYAQGKVLPEYKDENLQNSFGPNRFEQLRRVPAEQRQNVMAEMQRRCFRTEYTFQNGGIPQGMTIPIEGTDVDQEIEKILVENGW